MSANNWGECPLCKGVTKDKLKELQDKYGKISQEEYERLKEELDNEKDDEYDGTPLREDYEQGVDNKGYCYIIYSGVCQNCGASWQFRKENILPEDDADKKKVEKLAQK